MYVAYFDEIKPNIQADQHCYWVGGIIVAMENIAEIEEQVSALSQKIFGSEELVPETEFHAKFIYYKKGPFKTMEAEGRLKVFSQLGEILSNRKIIKQVYACINTNKLYGGVDPAEHAFMHYVERVENAIGIGKSAILIGDLDDEQARNMVRQFQRYRVNGTNSPYGRKITRIVDTVNFCRSHHSRMIQLADVYLYMKNKQRREAINWMDKEFEKILQKLELFPDSYKIWPNE